ncbi:MAG: RdgB/HAM1 family non-canonical purine NTP pyrophosphatase [Oscillospiraceae bacterium]
MEFLAATNNAHKLAEMRRILESQGHTVKSLADAGLCIEPEETGATFAENAAIKASATCAVAGLPAIADDSGLEVDALAGAPGVYSARFAGPHATDAANNEKLLRLLKDVPAEHRTARFTSAIALVLPSGAQLETEGHCPGTIGFAPQGENGFGYDPLFYVGGSSFAQMSAAEKDAVSHRARALAAFAAQLPAFLAANATE